MMENIGEAEGETWDDGLERVGRSAETICMDGCLELMADGQAVISGK